MWPAGLAQIFFNKIKKAPLTRGCVVSASFTLLLQLKHTLIHAAERADKIVGQIVKRHARSEILVRNSLCLVIHPAANRANPCLHNKFLL